MKILAYPQDANPYQELLYGQMRQQGVRVRYIGQWTPSHTANIALLPLEVVVLRLRGWRIVHLHWVFPFLLTGGTRYNWLRWLSQMWFYVFLAVTTAAGARLVWTAHNVLPHERVFHSDIAARRRLGQASSVVFAHAADVLNELRALNIRVARGVVIPHGPFAPVERAEHCRSPRSTDDVMHLLFFGRIAAYKGVEDLLAAVAMLPRQAGISVTIAGACDDSDLRRRLLELHAELGDRVALRLGHVPEHEVPNLLHQAHAVVLPFRQITTSGSALLALSHGRPVVVPDMPTLSNLPSGATIRYDGSTESLAATLLWVSRLSPQQLADMATAAQNFCAANSWQRAARTSLDALEDALRDSYRVVVGGPVAVYERGSQKQWTER